MSPFPSSRRKSGSLFLLLALLAAPAQAAPDRAGDYDGSQTEMAVALRLTADHHFLYQLSYGALDEQAEGKWEERDGKLFLTTEPAPNPPRFTIVSDTPAPAGEITARLDHEEMLQGSPLTLSLVYEGAERPVYADAGEDGRVPVEPGRTLEAIIPDLPVFTIPFDPYPLKPGGHRLVFRFEPNDLGVADFRGEPLAIDDDTLVFNRYDRTIRFKRR